MPSLELMPQALATKLQDPAASAQAAGLRYVTDEMPGIRRERSGNGFRYRYPTGEIVTDDKVYKRIKALAIPPAWTGVWICPDPCGHLQATGRDDRRRKQSRYHPRWREVRDQTKYSRMLAFGDALPVIRKRVNYDLGLPGLPRRRVLATVVRLLEISLIRVGNDEYARENDSFGLTTMRNQHVKVNGSELKFHFRGKSGKLHEVDIKDRRLARIVRACQELPGQELFQYLDEQGRRKAVRSEDVNDYLRIVSREDFTAKDFRTWAGTVLACRALRDLPTPTSKAQVKRNVLQAIESVAKKLGNTTAVCRKCYIHPEVLNAYLEGDLADALHRRTPRRAGQNERNLTAEEATVLAFLQQRLHEAKERLTRQLRESLRQSRKAKVRQRARVGPPSRRS